MNNRSACRGSRQGPNDHDDSDKTPVIGRNSQVFVRRFGTMAYDRLRSGTPRQTNHPRFLSTNFIAATKANGDPATIIIVQSLAGGFIMADIVSIRHKGRVRNSEAELTLASRGDGPDPRLVELVRLLARRAARDWYRRQDEERRRNGP